MRACLYVPGCVNVHILVRACSLAYPACNAYAPYCDCHLWPLSLHHIFLHYLIKGTTFGNMLLKIKCVFRFSLQFLSKDCSFWEEFSEILWMWKRLHLKYPLFMLGFNETWTDFFLGGGGEILNIKFYQTISSGSRVPCGQTEGRIHVIVAFWNFPDVPKNV
jgi:hypothetical protein